jgi:hypothetical protein
VTFTVALAVSLTLVGERGSGTEAHRDRERE